MLMKKDLANITREWMEQRRKDIIDRQKALNIRASGKSAESLEVDANEERVNLLGFDYFEFQEFGRKPTQATEPTVVLHKLIREWMRDKGLREEGGFNAYAIANKIHREGTRLYRKLKGEGNGAQSLDITGTIDRNLPDLEDALGQKVADTVTSGILRQFKR